VAEADVSLTRRSGLQPGDVLVQVNNTRITSADEAQRVLEQLPNGRARFVIERRGGYVYQDVVWQR